MMDIRIAIFLFLLCDNLSLRAKSEEQRNVTSGCISTEEGFGNGITFVGCNTSLQHSHIFLLKNSVDYERVRIELEVLERSVESTGQTSAICDSLIRHYLCNYVYPPCDAREHPIGICQEDCELFTSHRGECSFEINFLLGLDVNNLRNLEACNDTLRHLEVVSQGNNISRSSQCLEVAGLREVTATTDGLREVTTTVGNELSLPLVVAVPTAVTVLVTFGITLMVVHILHKWRKAKQRKYLESRTDSTPPCNLYHFNGLVSHEYDAPLFQLTMEDVMANSVLRNTVIPFDWLYIEEEIGHGAFGSVFKGIISPNSEISSKKIRVRVAIKTIKSSSASYAELKGFIEESMLMSEFRHPHVLGLIGISLDANNSPYLLLPYMENGDLRGFLKDKRGVSMSNITCYPVGLNSEILVRMCGEIAHGMEYLAGKKLVHRDLAARNCMVDGNLNVKVADFGLTRDIYETDYYRQHHKSLVPVKWMAPESLYDRISNEKTDVWSYGVTCWEIFSLGRAPYPTISNADMLTYLEHGHRLQKPFLCPEQLYSLILSCWREDPQDRPSFTEICLFFMSSNTSSHSGSSLQTIEEESLLDSVMSVIVNTGILKSERAESEDQDQYVDITPPTITPTFSEAVAVDLATPKAKRYDNVILQPEGKVNYLDGGCEDKNIILEGSFRQNERENSMNPINHSSSNMSTVPDVARDEDTVMEAGHVRQSSNLSDYVHMDPA